MLTHTKSEIEQYSELIKQLEDETDAMKIKRLAIKIAFVSSFIKRRDNLIFLGEADKTIAPAELFYCIRESLSNLQLGETECLCSSTLKKPLEFKIISQLYELFYKIIYNLIDYLLSVCVYLVEESGRAAIVMRIFCNDDNNLSYIHGDNIEAVKENDEWIIKICE